MKTKRTVFFKIFANTPPMWVCLLFALFLTLNTYADVTAEWSDEASVTFPEGYSDVNGIRFSEAMTYCPHNGWWVGGKTRISECIFESGQYSYITLTSSLSSYEIKKVGANVWENGGSHVYIQFCSESTFTSDDLGTMYFEGKGQGDNSISELNAPSGAKSARLYANAEAVMTRLTVTAAEAVACSAPVTISYAKSGTETGSAPANRDICTDNTSSITIPGKNTLVYDNKHVFVGWEKGGVTYSEGETYTITSADISAGSIEFTAVWRELSITNFTADKSGNYNVALAWSIPGICDLSKATTASGKAINDGNNVLYGSNTSIAYNELTNVVTAVGYSPQYGQYGVAFPIPETNGVETITIDCKGNSLPSGITLWGGIMNGTQAYWDYDDNLHYYAPSAWSKQIFTIDSKYWSGSYSSSTSVSYVGVYANAAANTDGVSFSVREARYHVSGFEDIHHVVLMRKVGSAATDTTETTGCVKLYSGTNSWFVDNAEKEAGDYYYSVFAVYNDGGHSVSSAVTANPVEIESIKVDPELSATLTNSLLLTTGSTSLVVNTADAYTGTLEYTVSPAGIITLNESTGAISAVAAGTATITVTAPATDTHYADSKNVELQVVALPETNLALDASGDDVELSWTIPGIIDLSTARTERSSSFTTNYSGVSNTTSSTLINNGEELDVTYSAAGNYSYNGFFFDVDLTSIESVSFDYKGDNPGGAWKGILPGIFDGSTIYWESSKGTFGLAETSWEPITIAPSDNLWKSGTYSSGDISELCFLVYAEGDPISNRHVYLRNLRYHCTGMTDIDHIVIMRTTSAAATDTLSGTKLYSGRMFHYTDNALSSGIYYYTIFAVYEDGCFPVEYKTFDNRSFTITYKDQGDNTFSGVLADGSPTTHKGSATTNLKKASKVGYAFGGWYTNSTCTGDAINVLAADAYDADITLYARWIEMNLHTPGKYERPVSDDGYGRKLRNYNTHDYEVYLMTLDESGRACNDNCDNYNGELFAGPVNLIHDGYRMFTAEKQVEAKSTDGWLALKAYKYQGSDSRAAGSSEFSEWNTTNGIKSSRYARLGNEYYVRLYVQGYEEFAFYGKDKSTDGNNLVIRIDGIPQAYTPSTTVHITRFTLTTNEPHFIEITGSSSNTESQFRCFSLQLPDVDRYTVTIAKNDNSFGTVSAASIANVRTGSPVYVNGNLVYIAGDTIIATPTESNAQYTYAFNNWTVGGAAVPATIAAATAITANFTRTAEEYTLTWDLDGGTVTTAGTGAAVDATGTPSTTVAFGEAITAPEVAKDGCRFLGWDVTPVATMPAENVTYTAQWAEPIIIGSGATLDVTNVYSSPGTAYFNVDGEGEEELCLDLKNQNKADWWVKMTPGSYKVSVKYGTSSGGVKVRIQIIDAETGTPITETEKDEHTTGTLFIATWSMDLGELINADKTYYIRVKDAYGSNGSTPKVGSVEVTPIEPETITNTATKRLDYDNVAVPYQIMPFDIENDGSNETCLFIGDNHKAEWKATITPDVYNIHVYYGKPSAGTKLKTYILDKNNDTVWVSSVRTTPSGRYETWEIKSVDLFGSVDKDEVYTIGIKDVYPGTGSKPYIGYIDFIPAVVKIPAETRLDATNTYSSVNIRTDVNFDDDALTSDESMKLDGTQADYVVQIQPGYYNVSLAYGAPEYSVRVAVTLTDPTGAEEERYLSTNPYYYESGSEGVEHHHISSMKCDLTGLDENKSYRLHIKDKYGSSNNLRVSHLVFSPIEPVLIANNTILNSTNTVTFNAPTQEFNVDGVEGNETCLLVSQHYGVSPVEWSVNVTPGVYDLNVHFGNNAASDGGYDMTIYLVDPEEPESPVTLYHKRVSDGTSLSYGVARCDFSGLVADKDYIIRVVDNWDGSKLRVGDIKFVTPAPLQIPSVTRLNASNVYVTPHYGKQNFNIEGEGEIECLNIRYQGEAAWFANLTPYVYNITVKYGKASASSKVRFGIIKVSTGDTIFVQQDDKGAVTEPTTYTAQANLVDLRSSITAGDLCKIFVKDNYPSLGSEPRVAYIDIARATINHTRTGLRVGDFGTVCLPYDIAAEDIQGADIYKLVEWPVGVCAVTLDEVDAMEAGHPYIYQATASEATWRYYPEGEPTAAASVNGLRGSYDRVVITPNDNNYIIYNNKLYYVDNLAYVGINKAYINRTEAEAASAPLTPAPGMRRIYMAVHGEQVVTGLDQIIDDKSLMTIKIIKDNQLYIIRDGKTYNAQGQLVNK